jgi:hypothetical protein
MRPSPASCVLCQCNAAVMPDRCSVRPVGAARACATVRSALAEGPQRALPQIMRPAHEAGQAWCAAAGSSDGGNRVVGRRQAACTGQASGPIDGRPRFVKRSINDGEKVKIAAIDPDFV